MTSPDDPLTVPVETSTPAQRRPAAERRRELILIAFRHIAERGLEGLRVREVAAEAGVNNATLHHYFATKDALIAAVVEYLLDEFRRPRAPRDEGRAPTAWEMLRLELADLGCLLHDAPELVAVATELVMRSRRDPAIAPGFEQTDRGWHGYLMENFRKGVRDGEFRPDLNPAAAATSLIAQMKGIGYHSLVHPADVDRLLEQLLAQLRAWLCPPAG
jgi:AcrR family transcriptional regulator